MTVHILRRSIAAIATVSLACSGTGERERAPAAPVVPDSAAAARATLDTLRRLGAVDYVVDSLVRRGDTTTVWAGPRVWNATDRPMSAVSVVAPARVVGVRQIFGG